MQRTSRTRNWLAGAALAMSLTMTMTLLQPIAAYGSDNPVTIDPTTNDFTLREGETWSETITVTVPPGATVNKADVYLLADTTGSMGGPIGAVKSGAASIMSGLVSALPGVDFAFGAGDFKDFPYDPYAFRHSQSLTADTAMVQSAINGWSASGGADVSEGQFFAYDRIADDVNPAGGTIGWRPNAKRILLVFGDAPAHDPVCAAVSGLSYDITEASVTAKLAGAGITFIGISTPTGPANGMDANPQLYSADYNALCGADTGSAGQATRIAAATGGVHQIGINSSEIVQTITDLITDAVTTINNLKLVAAGDTASFVQTISPAAGYGPLTSDISHTLTFTVDWVGVYACADTDQVYTGTLDVVADGAVVAQKTVRITVPACEDEPVLHGRMTGGGSLFTAEGTRVTHGLTLRCDGAAEPQRLQVNWGKGSNFHLEGLTSAICSLDPSIGAGSPTALFNTYTGSGTGRYNNTPGATAVWTFTDAGEPGSSDYGSIQIWDGDGNLVLDVSGTLTRGNHQAHDGDE